VALMSASEESGLGRPPELSAAEREAELLMAWRTSEITLAQGNFRYLPRHQLEEVYDAACDMLRERAPHESELHLRNAVRLAVRRRALNAIRDRKGRERIIDEAAPRVYDEARERASKLEPERQLLAQEDEYLIGEFLSELSVEEREVFVLVADGLSYRAIATALQIDEKHSRNVNAECEKKRERFLKLYEAGRLCGYRSHTINGLLSGQETSETAWRGAVAHLRHCRSCQGQHRVSSSELEAGFQQGALALLPLPALAASHVSLIDRVQAMLQRPLRLLDRAAPSNGGLRERAVEGVAGGAAAAKVAIAVGVIAVTGAAIEVHHVVDRSRPADRGSETVLSRQGVGQLSSSLIEGRSALFGSPEQRGQTRRGHGQEIASEGSPGHLLTGNTTGPGHLLEDTAGPGHLLSTVRAPGRSNASSQPSVPLREVQSRAASTASLQAPASPPLQPASTPKGPGRVLGP
jgi:RNA polymerase sigma factor (sigma-70 family)